MLENLPRGRRCSVHGMALAPDGLCILCRRDSKARHGATSIGAYIALGFGLLAIGGVAAALVIGQPPKETIGTEPRATRAPEPASVDPPTEVAGDPPPAPAPTPAQTTTRTSRATTTPHSPREEPPKSTTRARRRPPRVRRRPRTATPDPEAVARRREALAARKRMNAAFERQAMEQAIGRVRITVYLTSWCPACRKARQWLRENSVAAQQVDIERDLRGQQNLLRLNPRGTIPTFDIEGQVLVGFSARQIEQAIIRAARRHMTTL